jgi:ElaB/YqjD/DUF883 family membrane-anchored ribosome-binding protein
VPRSRFGEKGNQMVNNLFAKASQNGVPLKLTDMVNFNVNMIGTMKSPVLKINLKETGATIAEDLKKQATDFAMAKLDTAKSVVKDTLKSVKKELIKTAQEEIARKMRGAADTTADKQPAQETKKKLEEAGKGLINGFFKKKKAATDSIK